MKQNKIELFPLLAANLNFNNVTKQNRFFFSLLSTNFNFNNGTSETKYNRTLSTYSSEVSTTLHKIRQLCYWMYPRRVVGGSRGGGRVAALHEGGGEEAGAAGALQRALVPAVPALARHHHDVVHLQLQLVLRVGRVRHDAPEPTGKRTLSCCRREHVPH